MSAEQISPPATIGMLGGGQLGRYALMAATTMGYRTIVLDPDAVAPAGVIADEHFVAAFDDPEALQRLGNVCDVVTTEFENPPVESLVTLAASAPVAPAPASVGIAQDRVAEKRFLVDHGFAVGPYAELGVEEQGAGDSSTTSREAAERLAIGGAIVKSARLGYDGKGQRRVNSIAELDTAWAKLGGVPCVVESALDLRTEISVLLARTADGRIAVWDLAENQHVHGVLDVTSVPAQVDAGIATQALELGVAVAEALEYVGVLAVEMFVVDSSSPGSGTTGELLVNEIAPRPHNSGHWTLDASVTSQFEQQIRAVCGLGLADPSMTAPAVAMANLLGDLWFDDAGDIRQPAFAEVLEDPAATLHLYGKAEPRPGRKMGHITVTGDTPASAEERVRGLRATLEQ